MISISAVILEASLERHGWTLVCDSVNQLWRRPGKTSGCSATLKDRVFYCFSSSAHPFANDTAYCPFAVYTLLEHGGDYAVAASALKAEGYGNTLTAVDDYRIDDLDAADSTDLETDSLLQDPGPFPEHLLDVPGFIGEVMRYNVSTAVRPQPVLALAAAICLQATLAGRKVRDDRDNRTNMLIIGTAASGAGKDHARKVNRNILFQAGLSHLEGNEDLASDAGLLAAVEKSPAILFQLDEFGRFLKTIGDPKRSPHLYNILTALMKLYSSANTVYHGKAYADAQKNKLLYQPCVSLYGTSVPEHFYQALTKDSLEDGFVARLLIFEGHQHSPRQRTTYQSVPESLIAQAKWWGQFEGACHQNSSEQATPSPVPTTEEALKVFEGLETYVDEAHQSQGLMEQSVWARAEEKACRLALIYACSENAKNPVIDVAAAKWACELTVYLTKRLLFLASAWVSENKFDAQQKQMLRILTKAKKPMTKTDINRKTQSWNPRERDEVLANLIESAYIECMVVETKGRARRTYGLTSQ